MINQFSFTRGSLLSFIKNLDTKVIDVQPKEFNNNIHWHIGHILVTAESLLFGFPKQTNQLPEYYNDLFATGTKPADWPESVPSLANLIKDLETQAPRIEELTEEFLAKDLPYTLPFGNFKTYGDIYAMIIHHEAEHLGQIKAIKRIVENK
ncbi:DinB family protein [Virgibacillus salexigens]|uniref:DinB family protein n=1 Tax=Virgibacillus TaxID=84406 RepID=UPI00137199C9|nr:MULTISPECIES: DinB family protein [Virgibacillus]MYL42957.1 DinB family protein [Virgibacillus massiliensis]